MQVDTLVIGGGFYGCELALEMKRLGHERVLLVERRAGILERASFVNQARIHNGYHYPRSFATAARSHANFERFIEKYREAVTFDVVMLYAIAKGSRTSPSQFVRFCETIGIPCDVPPRHLERLFDPNLVEASFVVREFAFDSRKLAELLSQRLLGAGVEVRLNSEASVVTAHDEAVTVALGGEQVQARFVFNCTYGDLPFAGIGLRTTLKRELRTIPAWHARRVCA